MPKSILFFAIVITAYGCFSSTTTGQQISSFKISSSLNCQVGHYRFNGNGRLEAGIFQTIANTNALFFEDETIQKELELVESQRHDYDSAIKEWHDSWKTTIKEIHRKNRIKKRTHESNLEMIWENDENALKSLSEVLLPHQINIINELQFRCLFRTHGLKTLLNHEEFCEMLELSDRERDMLNKKTRELKSDVSRQAKLAIEDAIKTLIEPIQDPDKERFLKRWEHLFSSDKFISLEELIVFLDTQSYEWMKDSSDPLQKLLKRPSYKTGPAGNLRSVPGPNYRNDELSLFREFWKHAEFRDFLGLDGADEQQVSRIVKDSYRASQLLLNLSLDSNSQADVPFEDRKKKAYADSDEIEQESLVSIKRVLGVEGWNRVEDFANRINRASAGLVYDLLEGEFGEQLALKESERARIEASAKVSLKKLVETSQEIEQFCLEQYFGVVDEKSKKRMEELFGTPVKSAPANIGLLLMHQ